MVEKIQQQPMQYNFEEFEHLCLNKSMAMFDKAIQQGIAPTRKELLARAGKDLVLNTVYINLKIAEIIFDALRLLCVDMNELSNFSKQKEFLKRYAARLFVFQPVDCLTQLTCIILRTSSCTLGVICKPHYAVHGWRLAERMNSAILEFKMRLLGKCASPEDRIVQKEINPFGALRLFKTETAELLDPVPKTHAKKVDLYWQVQSLFRDFLKYSYVEEPNFCNKLIKKVQKLEPLGFFDVVREFDPHLKGKVEAPKCYLRPELVKPFAKFYKWALENKKKWMIEKNLNLAELREMIYYVAARFKSQQQKKYGSVSKEVSTIDEKIEAMDHLMSQCLRYGQVAMISQEITFNAYHLIYG